MADKTSYTIEEIVSSLVSEDDDFLKALVRAAISNRVDITDEMWEAGMPIPTPDFIKESATDDLRDGLRSALNNVGAVASMVQFQFTPSLKSTVTFE